MNRKDNIATATLFGCCLLVLIYTVACVAGVVWAIEDLIHGQHHELLDIIILVWVGISTLSGGVAKAR